MSDVAILASVRADARARNALVAACARIPADPLFVADDERVARLRELAASAGVAWIVLVDADAVPAVDAFGGLRRALSFAPALLGGRGLVGGKPHFGAMFAPPRTGPNPFELAPVAGIAEEPGFFDIIRGPVDVPQRGVVVAAAGFVRSLDATPLDPLLLHVDLAVAARAAGALVRCEPAMSFAADDDPVDVRRRMLGLRRYAVRAAWDIDGLHREPPGLRSLLVDRDTRVMGNFRGYAKRPLPAIETVTYRPRDAQPVRAALARTSDRYVLFSAAGRGVDRALIEALVERLERSNRHAVALEFDAPPFGAILANAARIAGAGALRGDTADAVFHDLVGGLPAQRRYAVGPSGPVVPARLPPLAAPRALDVIFVAAAQPMVTSQTLRELMQEPIGGVTRAVVAAGAETTRRLFQAYPAIEVVADAADPLLCAGLNHALAATTADAVAIVRDDVQVTHGVLDMLSAAFSRIPRLGAAVPRVGGGDRPEGIPEMEYSSEAELRVFAERRAATYAREAMLADYATTPLVVLSRAAVAAVGGFDEAFGFSRFGVEDLTRRMRAANYEVARCDDAYVHVFPPSGVESLTASLDTSEALAARCAERWRMRTGFDPMTDAVALIGEESAPAAPATERLRVLVPVADIAEWRAAEPFVRALAAAFRVEDPVEVAIGLDGSFPVPAAVPALREMLLQSGVAMERTLTVIVEAVGDLAAWRGAHVPCVRFGGDARAALADLPVVHTVAAVRDELREGATV